MSSDIDMIPAGHCTRPAACRRPWPAFAPGLARWRPRSAAVPAPGLAAAVVAAALLVLAGPLAARARADGDPASDVLAYQQSFVPADAGISVEQESELNALLGEAAARHLPVRVAIIASTGDLGSVTPLWRQPQNYARFLDIELGGIYPGTVVVVMPDGYGVAAVASRPGAGIEALAGLPPPATGGLGAAAVSAVQRLAVAATGSALPTPRVVVVSVRGSTDLMPWLVFALGVLLVVAAWTASLRARPLGAAAQ